MAQLVDWALELPTDKKKEMIEAIKEADIARHAGNKSWRNVFRHYRNNSTGKLKKIYSALYHHKTPVALEELWVAIGGK